MSELHPRGYIPRPSRHKPKSLNPWEDPKIVKSFCRLINTKALKTVRLLNKNWNNITVPFLRRSTHINLTRKGFQSIQDFWNVLHYNKLLSLPCPFQRYRISIQVTPDELIDDILRRQDTQIICLHYTTDQNVTYDSKQYRDLHQILQKNSKYLREFKYTFSFLEQAAVEDEGWYSHELNLPKLELEALEEFYFFSWSYGRLYEDRPFRHFLYEILTAAPNLRRFCSNTDDPDFINDFIYKGVFRKVDDLYLKKVTQSNLISIAGAGNGIRKIRSLGLNLVHLNQRLDLKKLGKVTEKLSKRLEQLAISKISLVNGKALPKFARLNTLLLHDCSGSLNELAQTKFPNLKSLYLSDWIQNINNEGQGDDYIASPHTGLQNLALKANVTGREDKRCKEKELTQLLSYLPIYFPNLRSFYLSMTKPLVNIIRSIFRFFPSLETLKIESLGSEFYLPEELFIPQHLHYHCLYSEPGLTGHSHDTLFALQRLKSLIFTAPNVESSSRLKYLSNSVVCHGLSRLPNLTFIHFDWHDGLCTDLIQRWIRRLSQVTISVRGSVPEVLQQLTMGDNTDDRLKICVHEATTHHDQNLNKFDFRNYF